MTPTTSHCGREHAAERLARRRDDRRRAGRGTPRHYDAPAIASGAGCVKGQQVIDQPLRVGPLDEEPGRPRMLDRVRGLTPSHHRHAENPDVGELGVDARGRLDTVHVRHRRRP